MVPEGVKTEELDKSVTQKYVDLHLDIGIEAMTEIGDGGEKMKHFATVISRTRVATATPSFSNTNRYTPSQGPIRIC